MRIRSIRPEFWLSSTVQAIDPKIVYVGALPPRPRDYYKLYAPTYARSFVYILSNLAEEVVYVGMSWNPGNRFDKHKRKRPWWSQVTHVVILQVDASNPDEAEALTRGLEILCIRRLAPTGNIAGVLA